MQFLRTFIAALTVSVVAVCVAQEATAGDWQFKRSYYTHQIPREFQAQFPPPPSRSAYRPAYMSPYPGFSLQGGYRINRIQINSGLSSDVTIQYESWLRER